MPRKLLLGKPILKLVLLEPKKELDLKVTSVTKCNLHQEFLQEAIHLNKASKGIGLNLVMQAIKNTATKVKRSNLSDCMDSA